jgi:hypothetical protein
MYLKSIGDGVRGRGKTIDTPLDPLFFGLDNIFKTKVFLLFTSPLVWLNNCGGVYLVNFFLASYWSALSWVWIILQDLALASHSGGFFRWYANVEKTSNKMSLTLSDAPAASQTTFYHWSIMLY